MNNDDIKNYYHRKRHRQYLKIYTGRILIILMTIIILSSNVTSIKIYFQGNTTQFDYYNQIDLGYTVNETNSTDNIIYINYTSHNLGGNHYGAHELWDTGTQYQRGYFISRQGSGLGMWTYYTTPGFVENYFNVNVTSPDGELTNFSLKIYYLNNTADVTINNIYVGSAQQLVDTYGFGKMGVANIDVADYVTNVIVYGQDVQQVYNQTIINPTSSNIKNVNSNDTFRITLNITHNDNPVNSSVTINNVQIVSNNTYNLNVDSTINNTLTYNINKDGSIIPSEDTMTCYDNDTNTVYGFIGHTTDTPVYTATGEVFEYNRSSNTWINITPVTTPNVLVIGNVFYDSGYCKFVSGYDKNTNPINPQLYGFSTSNHTYINLTQGITPMPTASDYKDVCYDTNNRKTYYFSGNSGGNYAVNNELYELNNSDNIIRNVTEQSLTRPSPRFYYFFYYDKSIDRCILIGGNQNDMSILYNDTWILNPNNMSWTNTNFTFNDTFNSYALGTSSYYTSRHAGILINGRTSASITNSSNSKFVWMCLSNESKCYHILNTPDGIIEHSSAYDSYSDVVRTLNGWISASQYADYSLIINISNVVNQNIYYDSGLVYFNVTLLNVNPGLYSLIVNSSYNNILLNSVSSGSVFVSSVQNNSVTGNIVENTITGITNVFVIILIIGIVIVISGLVATEFGWVESDLLKKVLLVSLIAIILLLIIISFNMFNVV